MKSESLDYFVGEVERITRRDEEQQPIYPKEELQITTFSKVLDFTAGTLFYLPGSFFATVWSDFIIPKTNAATYGATTGMAISCAGLAYFSNENPKIIGLAIATNLLFHLIKKW